VIDDDDLPAKGVDLGFLPRLWPFVRPYRRAFYLCLLILLLSFALELIGPWLLQQAIDGPMRATAMPRADRIRELCWLAAGFAGVVVVGTILGYAYSTMTAWNGQRVIRDVRRRLFDHLLHTGQSFHEKNPAGKLTTRITSDVENLNELIATGVLHSLFDLMKIVGVVAVMFLSELRLAVFTLASLPVVILISVLFRRNAQRAYRAVRGKLALQNAYAAEAIGGIRTTRAFLRTAAVEQRYDALNRDTTHAWLLTVRHFSVFFSLVDLAIRATSIGLLWFGGAAVLDGTLLPGQFVQFWFYFNLLASPIKELGEKYNVLQAAFASTERIFHILAEPRFPPPARRPGLVPARRGAAAVEFRGVSFAYRPDQPVLRDVSFRADPGQTVAIVGPTGAGKTTILSLVSRLRDATAGSIEVDGHDVRDLDVEALRRRIAVVAQDLFLFTGTVRDNVTLFDRRVADARVWHWLDVVGAGDFVRALPGQLDAKVQERGGTFSQGERQLLAFARALLIEPDILVLDEATASIDSAAEERLQRALHTALRGRTALVVAHRLSTVRGADRILVLEHGRIAEAGTHDELLRRRGRYAAMLASLQEVAEA
jgi:ATP-binding cassette subfamily B protein